MNSKFLCEDSEYFSRMVVETLLKVKTVDSLSGIVKYPLKSIKTIKIHGQSVRESCALPGFALHMGRATQSMPTIINGAKIACLDFELRKAKMQLGVQIIVTNPTEL